MNFPRKSSLAERCAGLILAGGKSLRMGQSKAMLPFGSEPLLARLVRIVSGVASPVVVVAARGQELPTLPDKVQIVYDRHEGRGPLEGLAAGMTALQGKADRVYASGCDAPLLSPAFIRRVVERLGERDAAVPQIEGRLHPLAAVYRLSVLTQVEGMLAEDRLKTVSLFDRIKTRVLGPEDFADIDPEFHSLLNTNEPHDYQRALALAGFNPS